ncbi:MAG TPA: glycosyltransferase family 39 protein, partial [Terriglobia bacterium]|nr:glycosyltransferase family 39 protein [Terriglobia bacterium]
QRDFDRYVTWLFALFLAGMFVHAIRVDLRLALWTDEIFTYYISERPAIPDIFAAIRDGADAQPPLYSLVVRALRPLIPNDGLRLRLPSTLGVFLMSSCIFFFVRRRLPALFAILASLAALRLVWPYVSEGRAYGITLGCISVALVCWQRSTDGSKVLIPSAVGISLAAAIAFHYFSVFVIGALLVGEAMRWLNLRKVNLRMLAALLMPIAVLIPHVLLLRGPQALVKNYWSKAQPSTLYEYYLPAVLILRNFLILALALCIGVHVVAFIRRRLRQPVTSHMPKQEWLAALTLVVLPTGVILTSLLTVKMFVDRYVLWSAIGMGISLAVLLHRGLRDSQLAAGLLLLPLLLWSYQTVRARAPSGLQHSGSLQQQIQAAHAEPAPIVVPHLHHFMEIWFYSNDEIRSRLIYFVSPDLEFHYKKSDTASLLMSALRRHVPIGVEDYEAFIRANPRFIVAGDGEGDWIVPHLRASNFRFVPMEGAELLYEVQAP